MKSAFPNQLCRALAYAELGRKTGSGNPKFQDAILNPLLGLSASLLLLPSRLNPGSGRLAGAGRRNCKQWRPGLPPPSAHTESQPSRRTPTLGRRLPGPGAHAQPGPARSSPRASERIGPAVGDLTAIAACLGRRRPKVSGLTQLAREKTPSTAPMVTLGPRPPLRAAPCAVANYRLRCRLRNATISQAGNRARPSQDAQHVIEWPRPWPTDSLAEEEEEGGATAAGYAGASKGSVLTALASLGAMKKWDVCKAGGKQQAMLGRLITS